MFGFVKKAIHSAGHAVGSATHAVSSTLGKVPVVGKGLHGAFELTVGEPFNVASAVMQGRRIDRAVVDHFKRTLSDIREVAPYAQTVVAFVPGIGPGISGAIAGGLALASGAKITDALVAATRGALPGGALAQAAFDVGSAAIQGRPLDQVALNALPLNAEQKRLFVAGLSTAKDIAHGKRVDVALYNSAVSSLPPEAQQALKVGAALAHGQVLQAVKAAGSGVAQAAGQRAASVATKGVKDMSLFSSLGSVVKKVTGGSAAKVALNAGAKLAVAKPVAGGLAFTFPKQGVTLSQGMDLAHNVVSAYNSANPERKASAKRIVDRTKVLAASGDKDAQRGYLLLSRRAAALKAASQFQVIRTGHVRRKVA